MFFSELYKIIVNKVTFVGFEMGGVGDCTNRSPLDPTLGLYDLKCEPVYCL